MTNNKKHITDQTCLIFSTIYILQNLNICLYVSVTGKLKNVSHLTKLLIVIVFICLNKTRNTYTYMDERTYRYICHFYPRNLINKQIQLSRKQLFGRI